MRFLNALIAFYGALFALAWWGLTGLIVVLVLGILTDRVLKSYELSRLQNEERVRNDALSARNRDKVSAFTHSGCRFFGSGDHIWEYEHLFDLCVSMTDNGLADLRNDQYLMVKTEHGVVLAVNREGWPAHMDQWKTRDILALMVERPVKHFPTSESALQVDAERRQRKLEAIEQRVSDRQRQLGERKSRDIGPGATAIYVISSRGQEHCKIGISDDPEKRRAGLQTGNPSRLSVHTASGC